MRPLLLLLLLLLLSAVGIAARTADVLTLKREGTVVLSAGLEKLESLSPAQDVTLFEPHEQRDRAYRAIPLRELLDAVYGKDWWKDGYLVFTCRDGYQPAIPVTRFVQSRALLAFATADGNKFKLHDLDKEVHLGPFYLVWDNRDDPSVRRDMAHEWPYQVTSIDLVSFGTRYPGLIPPKTASPAATRGFAHYKSYCMVCHRLNGEGGDKAPDLNMPHSVTEYWKEPWLERFILDPPSVRANTQMPGLAPDLPDREAVARDIIAYLKAMRRP